MDSLHRRGWLRWLALTGLAGVSVMLAAGGSGAARSASAVGSRATAPCSSAQKQALKERAKSYKGNGKIAIGVGPGSFSVKKPACQWYVGVSLPHFKDPYWIANAYGIIQEAKRLG